MKKRLFVLLVACGLASPAWAALDINSATQADLAALPGLGPAKARAIVKYREKHGPFRNLNDVINVKGMSRESVAKLGEELAKAEPQPAGKHRK
ncbi:competence protein ComEA [Sulfuritortus calidifontis]|uniref:Competence protein ComEA n=1 Tax=Sulfuritortus calidifontis TaxID=1914471 RepID=A0A4R3K0T9_9PROT|nr:helix-hairpin-helix domain-containing protein [Sulfuritortus calidifontis]TCS73465.1 competence protein ComEA [Sulfuritortus calidifontis]